MLYSMQHQSYVCLYLIFFHHFFEFSSLYFIFVRMHNFIAKRHMHARKGINWTVWSQLSNRFVIVCVYLFVCLTAESCFTQMHSLCTFIKHIFYLYWSVFIKLAHQTLFDVSRLIKFKINFDMHLKAIWFSSFFA